MVSVKKVQLLKQLMNSPAYILIIDYFILQGSEFAVCLQHQHVVDLLVTT